MQLMQVAASNPIPPSGKALLRDVRERYLTALLDADVSQARSVALAALDGGVTLPELYLHVFQWALYEVGTRWQDGQATVAQEHLATATTQTLMARLWPSADPAVGTPQRAIVTATENDFHVLGPRFLADFLESEGWTVLDLGAATPTGEVVSLVRQTAPALVCLSTTLPVHLEGARRAVAALAELQPRPLIAVGGQAYGGDPAVARAAGADLYAGDAATFLEALAEHLGAVPRAASAVTR